MLKPINYRAGDLVQLNKETIHTLNPFRLVSPSIYRIAQLNSQEVRLLWEIESYNIDQIKPIPINGRDDSRIRLRIDRNATYVMEGMSQPPAETSPTYYLDQIKQLGWTDLLQEIEQQRIKYVHQVQRYLSQHYSKSLLIID